MYRDFGNFKSKFEIEDVDSSLGTLAPQGLNAKAEFQFDIFSETNSHFTTISN